MNITMKIWTYAVAMTFVSAHAVAQKLQIEFFSPNIVHVTKTPDGKVVDKKSFVVTASPENVKVKKSTDGTVTTYKSSALNVTVDEKTGKVTFAKVDGTRLLSEGEYAFIPITEGIDKGAYKVKQCFALDADEPIYGVGMLQNGKMSLRGEHRKMQQSNLQDYAHFFQSIKGYGIYWDNYSPTDLNDNKTLELESQVGKLVDYYFMYGDNADGVIREMRHLTGKVPMLPMWTYGFHQSRERYKTQNELLEVVRKYREMKIPFDGIIQDWQYWGSNYTWNAMEFIHSNFNNAQKMIDEVHAKNAHISISIWASFGPQTKPYKQLKEKGLLFSFDTWPESGLDSWPPRKDYPSGVRVYDCYSQDARDIYWENLSRLHKMGIDAWWMDSTDPDHINYKESDLDEECSVGSYRSVRNLFPFMTVGGVDEHQRAVDNKKRVFILTRSYFAGQQRYGANTWSGDVGSSWESLRNQVPLCLNYTLTANPNVNSDIGGFFAGVYNRSYLDNSGTKNPQFQELYVRWMQFGLFNPMMRSHGTDVYRELYYYGKPGEPVFDALLSAVKMRYNLLPYIYSTSWQVSKNDDSFMRALIMDFKNDKNTWNLGKQYMFGRSILVCPVIDPLYTKEKVVKTDEQSGWNKQDNNDFANGWPVINWSEKKLYEVYLPAGTQWYDYWTNEKLNGGQKIKAAAPLAHSPLYIKAGSILPMGQDLQYVNEKAWDNITLRIYPGTNASFTLYEDEGDNYDYQKGQYTEIPMTWNDKSRTLTIEIRKGAYPGMLNNRNFKVTTPDGKVKNVRYTGKKVSIRF
jgi:alpha-D-xyloside xylohydrolase